MSLDFYYAPHSSAASAHWALEELAVPYDKVRVDLKAGQQREASFLSINPNGKVPVLMHDGVAIFESAAIILYLGETFGVDRGLFPPLGPSRGEAMKWVVWCNASLGEASARFYRNGSSRISPEEQNARAKETARRDVGRYLDVLEKTLTGRSFLVDDKFSLVDVHVASWMEYLRAIGIDLAPYRAIDAWTSKCVERPAHGRASEETVR